MSQGKKITAIVLSAVAAVLLLGCQFLNWFGVGGVAGYGPWGVSFLGISVSWFSIMSQLGGAWQPWALMGAGVLVTVGGVLAGLSIIPVVKMKNRAAGLMGMLAGGIGLLGLALGLATFFTGGSSGGGSSGGSGNSPFAGGAGLEVGFFVAIAAAAVAFVGGGIGFTLKPDGQAMPMSGMDWGADTGMAPPPATGPVRSFTASGPPPPAPPRIIRNTPPPTAPRPAAPAARPAAPAARPAAPAARPAAPAPRPAGVPARPGTPAARPPAVPPRK